MYSEIINIGEKVYIGGFVGSGYEELNQKIGIVKKISHIEIDGVPTFIARLDIGDKYEADINFDYLYKLEDIKTVDGVSHIKHFSGSLSNPLNYYFQLHSIKEKPDFIISGYGTSYLFCKDIDDRLVPLILTSLN
jgi:hypothetical protein